jgi:hypothetical protein
MSHVGDMLRRFADQADERAREYNLTEWVLFRLAPDAPRDLRAWKFFRQAAGVWLRRDAPEFDAYRAEFCAVSTEHYEMRPDGAVAQIYEVQ